MRCIMPTNDFLTAWRFRMTGSGRSARSRNALTGLGSLSTS
jgi:hypothetical protein